MLSFLNNIHVNWTQQIYLTFELCLPILLSVTLTMMLSIQLTMSALSSSKYVLFSVCYPLYKTVCKVLFWDCHQLSRNILLNLIHHLKSSFQQQLLLWENPEIVECQIWTVGGQKDLGDVIFCKKKHRCIGCAKWEVV